MFARAIRLVGLILVCSSVGGPSLGGPPSDAALSKIEILDVDNAHALGKTRKDGHPVCSLEAHTREDTQFVRRLWETYGPVFKFEDWNNFGPDSSYRQIRLIHNGKVLILNSWHPLVERNPGLVAASYGAISLDGRSRAEVLSADDPGYVAKRLAFDATVDQCLSHGKARR